MGLPAISSVLIFINKLVLNYNYLFPFQLYRVINIYQIYSIRINCPSTSQNYNLTNSSPFHSFQHNHTCILDSKMYRKMYSWKAHSDTPSHTSSSTHYILHSGISVGNSSALSNRTPWLLYLYLSSSTNMIINNFKLFIKTEQFSISGFYHHFISIESLESHF